MRVIRAKGKVEVFIIDDTARCGWHICSFSVATVRGLAAQGHLVRTSDAPETYKIKEGVS